jgi:hypothetical protein
VSGEEVAKLTAENVRLRAELNRWAYEHGRELGRAVEAESAIGRVRAVLYSASSNDESTHLHQDISAALEGES